MLWAVGITAKDGEIIYDWFTVKTLLFPVAWRTGSCGHISVGMLFFIFILI